MGDLDALLRLYQQLDARNAGAVGAKAEGALHAILNRTGMALLVAESARGEVVGTVTLVILPNLTHNSQPWAQVENMVTDASVRGLGVGRLLIGACLRLASEAGCYKVQLQSANTRTTPENDAHGFYRHLGFEATSAGFRYYFERE